MILRLGSCPFGLYYNSLLFGEQSFTLLVGHAIAKELLTLVLTLQGLLFETMSREARGDSELIGTIREDANRCENSFSVIQ